MMKKNESEFRKLFVLILWQRLAKLAQADPGGWH